MYVDTVSLLCRGYLLVSILMSLVMLSGDKDVKNIVIVEGEEIKINHDWMKSIDHCLILQKFP